MSFENKVVIVTGAGSGIGAATATLFAKEGAFVVLADVNQKRIEVVGDQIAEKYKPPLLVVGNVAKEVDANNIINQTVEKFGKLDILVNNAGILKLGSLLNSNFVEVFDELISNNLRSVVLLSSLAAPYLIKSKGNIVNLSSTSAASYPNVPDLMPYSISKIGVERFTRAAALELSKHGVRVNAVCPGGVKTNIASTNDSIRLVAADPSMRTTPLGKFANPVEIADLICFLASEKAISITGSIYVCDNGMLLH